MKSILKFTKFINKNEAITAILAAIFIVAQVACDMNLPKYMSLMTQLSRTPTSTPNDLLKCGAAMITCVTLSFVFAVLTAVFTSKACTNLFCRIRSLSYAKIQTFSLEEINHFSVSSLIIRCTSDVTNIQNLFYIGFQTVVKLPVVSVWAGIKMYSIGVSVMMSVFISVAIGFIVIMITIVKAKPYARKAQALTDELNNSMMEKLAGIDTVRAYDATEYQNNKLNDVDDSLTENSRMTQVVLAFMNPVITADMSLLSATVYVLAAFVINTLQDSVRLEKFAEMVGFVPYSLQLLLVLILIANVVVLYPRAITSSERIFEILNTEPAITDGPGAVPKEAGTVEFKNVSYAFPGSDKAFLEGLSFKCKKGDTLAIIGATGCGKTTLLNLIIRFYDAACGEVLVDGVNVKDYILTDLRDKLGYVPQGALLFEGSVESNVLYAYDDTDGMDGIMEDAVEYAGAKEFIENLSNKYQEQVKRRGSNFSGGQRQRLSIARALAKRPEILIFDDSFSALDFKTDKMIREFLKENYKDVTKIIVAQRIGTIKDADTIIVMEDGKIAGQGSHTELLKSCDVYKKIALSQLSEEELAG